MFRDKMSPDNIENWKCIYETSLEGEAQLVQAYLRDQGLECQILSKKDSAYSVNFGDLSTIFLYVPDKDQKAALKALEEWKKASAKTGEDAADTQEDESGWQHKDQEGSPDEGTDSDQSKTDSS